MTPREGAAGAPKRYRLPGARSDPAGGSDPGGGLDPEEAEPDLRPSGSARLLTADGTGADGAGTVGGDAHGIGQLNAATEANHPRWWHRALDSLWNRVPEPEPMTAFVLAGGGSRGAVQVGMLSELVDRGIVADRVYGASVGAVNGAAYAGDPTPEGMAHLRAIWRGLTGNDVFPRGRMDGPWMFFQQREAVHPNIGLRRILTEGVRFDRLEDAAIPLEVVATSLSDGRERWLTHGPAVDAILASAAIPAIFPPVTIDGDTLVDGGVVNNVPISRAVAAGATRVYVLLCGPLHYQPKKPKRPVEAVMATFFVAIHARFVRELSLIPPGVEVVVFSGGGDPASAYRDFSATPDLIEEGRAEVAAVLNRYRDTSQDLVALPPAARRFAVPRRAAVVERAGNADQADSAFDGREARESATTAPNASKP